MRFALYNSALMVYRLYFLGMFDYNLLKQTNACTMVGPLSVTVEDIYLIRIKTDAVLPIRPKFYKQYMGDIYNDHQKNSVDGLYDGLNN